MVVKLPDDEAGVETTGPGLGAALTPEQSYDSTAPSVSTPLVGRIAAGGPIPVEFAMGAVDGFGGNRNPHLAWDDAPAGTRSFALLCIDTDAPTDGALVANAAVPIPVAHPRGDFVHWAVADIPAGTREIPAGSCSDGLRQRGKPAGRDAGGLVARPARVHPAVQHAPHPVEAVDVLHDVELADARPVPPGYQFHPGEPVLPSHLPKCRE